MASKRIVWDIQKDRINRTKHRIGFEEASGVFFDVMSITVDDADHSWYEHRFISIGKTKLQKLLIVFSILLKRFRVRTKFDRKTKKVKRPFIQNRGSRLLRCRRKLVDYWKPLFKLSPQSRASLSR